MLKYLHAVLHLKIVFGMRTHDQFAHIKELARSVFGGKF